jgi:HEAT repeat protein
MMEAVSWSALNATIRAGHTTLGTRPARAASIVAMRTLLLLALAVSAGASEVQLRISLPEGRGAFCRGEAIPVTLTFSGLTEKSHRLVTMPADRASHAAVYDKFSVSPEEGAEDPMARWGAPLLASSLTPAGQPSHAKPATVTVHLNEWFRFRAPGRYTVQLRSGRVIEHDGGEKFEPLFLDSNALEIEIVEPPEGWAQQTLASAVAALEAGAPMSHSLADNQHRLALRYLGTPEAARALARLSARAETGIEAALRMSPHPEAAIEEMERLIADPHTPVRASWLQTLIQLGVRAGLPPLDPHAERDPKYMSRYAAERARCTALMLDALPRKEGEARLVTTTALYHLGAPISVAMLRDLLLAAPPGAGIDPFNLLGSLWPVIASPDIGPFLDQILANSQGALRQLAYRRLFELDPAGARRRLIDELRTDPMALAPYSTLPLPDGELPELDARLTELLKSENPPWPLVTRFGTPVLLPDVLAAMDRVQAPCLSDPIFYLLRVAPDEGRRRFHARREHEAKCGSLPIPGDSPLLFNSALEDLFIADLAHADARRRTSAASTLFRRGTPRARQPLWQAMERWRASLGEQTTDLPQEVRNEEVHLAMAIQSARGWVAAAEDLDRLERLCATDHCRANVRSHRETLAKPVGMHHNPGSPLDEVHLGSHIVKVPEGVRERLLLYPPGRTFLIRLADRDSWAIQRFEERLRAVFDEAGRTLTIDDAQDSLRSFR